MEFSHSVVYPVGVPPHLELERPPPGVRMNSYHGMPGTACGLALRLGQFSFAASSFGVMVSIQDFAAVTAFCFLVAATVLQCIWSLVLAIVDTYALLVRRNLHNPLIISLVSIGDGVTSTLTFAAACATAGITVLIDNDLNECAWNPCPKYESAAAMAFLSWVLGTVTFVLTFWLLSTR